MSRKRKRRRGGSSRPTSRPDAPAVSETPSGDGDASPDRAPPAVPAKTDDEPPRPRGLFGGTAPSPYPKFGVSMAAGLRAVGGSPLILGLSFGFLLLTWALFVALGVDVTPRLLGILMALSPANLFSDVPVAFAAGTPVATVVAVVALGILRSLTWGVLGLLIVDELSEGRADLRSALRRLPKVAASLLVIDMIEVALVVVLLQVIVQLLGQLGILGVLVSIYFLVMAPVVAVTEEARAQDALRRSFRAARLPGTRHVAVVMAYFFFIFWISAISPFPIFAPATPTVVAWAFAMVTTFIHVGVFGALVYRWVAVRHLVPAQATPART
jgi:hypothetical protein